LSFLQTQPEVFLRKKRDEDVAQVVEHVPNVQSPRFNPQERQEKGDGGGEKKVNFSWRNGFKQ
jgi:hypothetical protein